MSISVDDWMCSQLNNISKQLTKAKHALASEPFGGVDIIFFGDFIQFPPIMDSPLYSGWKNESIRSTNLQAEVKKQLGINLWRQVNQVVLLDEQMRIKDKAYQDLLNRLREGKCTDSDVAMLNKKSYWKILWKYRYNFRQSHNYTR